MNKIKEIYSKLDSKIVIDDPKKPLVVFDFDNICIGIVRRHGQPSMLLRPGTKELLSALQESSNLVIFTTMPKLQADQVIGSVSDAHVAYFNSGVKKLVYQPKLWELRSLLPKFVFSEKLEKFSDKIFIFSGKNEDFSKNLKNCEKILIEKWEGGNSKDRRLELIAKHGDVNYEEKFFNDVVASMPKKLIKQDLISLTTQRYDAKWYEKLLN